MVFLWICLIVLLVALLHAILYMLSMMAKRNRGHGFCGRLGQTRFAHRGLHAIRAGIPENSMRAFRLAANNGYGAELDVHLSRDGRLVVMHDNSLKRTAGANANITAVNSQVLNQLTLEGTKEKIPYLEEVVPLFAGKAPILIEIKSEFGNYEELTRKVCNLMKQNPEVEFAIESFDPRVLFWLRKHRPDIVRGQLSCNFFKERKNLSAPLAFLLSNLMFNFLTFPDFISYKVEDRDNLAPALCKKIWRVKEFSWTVTSQEQADLLLEQNNTIIFEGFPAKKE